MFKYTPSSSQIYVLIKVEFSPRRYSAFYLQKFFALHFAKYKIQAEILVESLQKFSPPLKTQLLIKKPNFKLKSSFS